MSGVYVERRGRGPAVVLLHGFGQDHTCWGLLGEVLAERHTLLLVDLPRHGRSRAVGGSFEEGARAIADAVGAPAVWLGYSMGGRYALRVALDRPELVRGLITIGATAGLDDPAERAARVADDAALATELEREGVARFFERWLARPMFGGLPVEAQFRAAREAQDAGALAEALRRAGTGAMAPLWARLGELRAPLTCVAGERDTKFVAAARRMASITGARVEVIGGAGHAAHLERPEATWAVIEAEGS